MSDIDTTDHESLSEFATLTDLDGRLLVVFHELLRCRNATVVARRLAVTQSTVSHSLGRLRRLHDDELFVRRPHGLEPTKRALELGPLVERVLTAGHELFGGPPAFDPGSSAHTFTVSASEFVTALIGGPLIERWSTEAPGISLVTRQLDAKRAADLLRRGELDAAVGRFDVQPPAGLIRRSLIEDEYCVVVRRDHPVIRDSIDMATYLSAGHVLASSPSEGAPDESIPRGLRVRAVVPAWLTALAVVASSNAIATCPTLLAERQSDRLGLRMLPVPGPAAAIEISLVHRIGPDDATVWLVTELERSIAGPPNGG